jgi:hypothetical protein
MMPDAHSQHERDLLRYRPKPQSKPAKKRARRKRKNDAARD